MIVIGIVTVVVSAQFVAVIVTFVYGIAANLCFTGGWVAELFVKRLWPGRIDVFGEVAFFVGTVFSAETMQLKESHRLGSDWW